MTNRRESVETADPIEKAADFIRQGQIVAVKGLGGYHLVAEAVNARRSCGFETARCARKSPLP